MPDNVMIRVDIDFGDIRKKLLRGVDRAQHALDQKIMADTDPYVPFNRGELSRSVGRSSKPGLLVYDMPYARRLFYNPQYDFQHKPGHHLAGGDWFGRSKADNEKTWIADVERVMKEIR